MARALAAALAARAALSTSLAAKLTLKAGLVMLAQARASVAVVGVQILGIFPSLEAILRRPQEPTVQRVSVAAAMMDGWRTSRLPAV